jgi:hypothetical protein
VAERNRAILIRWSKKDENHLALLQLASGLIAFKKAHRANRQRPTGIGPKCDSQEILASPAPDSAPALRRAATLAA